MAFDLAITASAAWKVGSRLTRPAQPKGDRTMTVFYVAVITAFAAFYVAVSAAAFATALDAKFPNAWEV